MKHTHTHTHAHTHVCVCVCVCVCVYSYQFCSNLIGILLMVVVFRKPAKNFVTLHSLMIVSFSSYVKI